MAKTEVCGRPEASDVEPDLQDLREEYRGTPKHERGVSFEEAFCLSKIGHQPEGYDGPDRYCTKYTLQAPGIDWCQVHKKNANLPQNELAGLKHSAYALSGSVRKSFSQEEAAAYEAIVDEWRAFYDLEAPDKLHTLSEAAIEMVRLARINEFLEDPEMGGVEVIRDRLGPTGEVVKERDAHHILAEKRSTLRQIEKLKETIRDEAQSVEVSGGGLGELRAALNGALEQEPEQSFAERALEREQERDSSE